MRVGELPRVLNEAEAALMKAGVSVYQRTGQLVRVVRADDNNLGGVAGTTGALGVIPVQEYWLREKFIGSARWKKERTLKEEITLITAEPDLSYAKHYLQRSGDWDLP